MADFHFHFHYAYRTKVGTAQISSVEFGQGFPGGPKPAPYEATHTIAPFRETAGEQRLQRHDSEGKAIPSKGETRADVEKFDLLEQIWPKPEG